jgi:translation initiation factor 3 subunit F
MDTVSSIPKMNGGDFEKAFNGHLQDILMVVYLANLTRTQLAIAERLNGLEL